MVDQEDVPFCMILRANAIKYYMSVIFILMSYNYIYIYIYI